MWDYIDLRKKIKEWYKVEDFVIVICLLFWKNLSFGGKRYLNSVFLVRSFCEVGWYSGKCYRLF